MTMQDAVDKIVAAHPFGAASAAKRGRNPDFPYVPVIDHGKQEFGLVRHPTEQIRAKAFTTREAAVAYAEKVLDARRAHMRKSFFERGARAIREQYGLPRELEAATE